MQRSPRRGATAGAGIGLFVWVIDYRFFLDPAGPPAPISHWILQMAHLTAAPALAWVLVPAVVLMLAGSGIGWLAAYALSGGSGQALKKP